MSESESDQEPSIEEILASIRQIISDDDEESAAAEEAVPEEPAAQEEPEPKAAPEPEPEPEPAPAPAPKPQPAEEDVLELTEEMQEPMPEIDLQDPEPEIVPEPPVDDTEDDIISDTAKAAALGSLAKLVGGMPVSRAKGYDGVTLEDIVRDLLHPMLREWTDANLPPMVERIVQKEIEKLARRAMDE